MRAVLVGVLAAAAAALAGAQAGGAADAQEALAVSAAAPVVDGIVQPGEYALTRDLRGTTLSLSRTADHVYIAVSAPTTGWVAVGTGTGRMDGSRIFIGFVKDGAATFEEDLGRGHRHYVAPDASEAPAATAHALSESGGRTVLEVEVDSSRILPAGASELRLIVAYGTRDSLSTYHRFRASLSVPLG